MLKNGTWIFGNSASDYVFVQIKQMGLRLVFFADGYEGH